MDRIRNPQSHNGTSRLAFHASRIIIDAGVLISMAAMSMPFVTTGGADRNSVAADALPVLIMLVPIFLVTLIPDHSKPISAPLGWASLALGAAAFPYAVVKYLDATNLAATLGGSVGFGARLLIFGTFVTVAGIGVSLAGIRLRLPSGGTYPARRAAPGQTPPRPRSARPVGPTGSDPRRAARRQAPPAVRPSPTPQPRPQRPADPGRGAGSGER